MQDLSKRIKFLKLRRKLWKSLPYRIYIEIYERILAFILKANKKNTKLIFINGMRRSGNHYLMKTLMDSTSATVFFYNNQKAFKKISLKNGIQTKFRWSKHILVIVGFEDLLREDFIRASAFVEDTCFSNAESLQLLIIRDVRNLMASRLNHAHLSVGLRAKPHIVERVRKIWYDHHRQWPDTTCHTIRYSYFSTDLKKIELKPYHMNFIIEPQKVMNRYGGGSSFETNDFDSRYLNFTHDPIYLQLIEGFQELDEKIHGKW